MDKNLIKVLIYLVLIFIFAYYIVYMWKEENNDLFRYNPKGCSGCNY